MRVLAISGSPRGRQSNTRKLAEAVLQGAQSVGADVELVDLGELNLAYCIGCGVCHSIGTCSRKDEFEPLHEKMLTSEGLVLASPVYFASVTAQLKTVIDRLSDDIHCQRFLGKYACAVATSGGEESATAVDYMNDVLVRLGCTSVGGVGAAMAIPGDFEAALQSARALGVDLVQAFNEHRTYPDQDAIHAAMQERFRRLVSANKDTWTYEYEYWNDQGWV